MNDPHISRISTIWTLVRQAHGAADGQSRETAQERVLALYSGAIYRYLLKLLGDSQAADEVFQEFALGFVQGRFRHAAPEKGRFRDYVKTSVVRLVQRYRQQRRRDDRHVELAQDVVSAEAPPDDSLDAAFRDSCREELLAKTWERLRSEQEEAGHAYYTVLDYRARHPDATSEQAALELSANSDVRGSISPAALRKTLQRARTRFGELLIDEVRRLLMSEREEDVEQELADLQLLAWCQPTRR